MTSGVVVTGAQGPKAPASGATAAGSGSGQKVVSVPLPLDQTRMLVPSALSEYRLP